MLEDVVDTCIDEFFVWLCLRGGKKWRLFGSWLPRELLVQNESTVAINVAEGIQEVSRRLWLFCKLFPTTYLLEFLKWLLAINFSLFRDRESLPVFRHSGGFVSASMMPSYSGSTRSSQSYHKYVLRYSRYYTSIGRFMIKSITVAYFIGKHIDIIVLLTAQDLYFCQILWMTFALRSPQSPRSRLFPVVFMRTFFSLRLIQIFRHEIW